MIKRQIIDSYYFPLREFELVTKPKISYNPNTAGQVELFFENWRIYRSEIDAEASVGEIAILEDKSVVNLYIEVSLPDDEQIGKEITSGLTKLLLKG